MIELVSIVVAQPIMYWKEARSSRIFYPSINDETRAETSPYWDMNQISTQSSLEVRASISDRTSGPGARPPGGPCLHLNCNVSLIIHVKKNKQKNLGQPSKKGEDDGGNNYLLSRVGMPHHLNWQLWRITATDCFEQTKLNGNKATIISQETKGKKILISAKSMQSRCMKGYTVRPA